LHDPISYLYKSYFPEIQYDDIAVSKSTFEKQKILILRLTGFEKFTSDKKEKLSLWLKDKIKHSSEEGYLLQSSLQFLGQNNISLPERSTDLESLIIERIQKYKELNVAKFDTFLSVKKKTLIESWGSNSENLRDIQKLPLNFSIAEIDKEITRKNKLKFMLDKCVSSVTRLNLSNENIYYYSENFTVHSRNKADSISNEYLFLLSAYSIHRKNKINDYLIESYHHHLNRLREKEKCIYDSEVIKFQKNINSYLKYLPDILNLITDSNIKDDLPFGSVRKKIYEICPKEQLEQISTETT
jgi:hypothetical protein